MTSNLITALSGVDEKSLQDVAHSRSCQDEQRCEGFSLSNAPRKEKKIKDNIVLTLLSVIGFLLLVSCNNTIDSPKVNTPVESGYGRIGIVLAGWETPQTAAQQQARTVFPSAVFDKYVYTFTKTGEAAGVEKTPDSEGFFTLEVGSYTVAVQAYTGNEEPYTLAANGVSAQFSVGPGNNASVEVRLDAVTAGAQGVFTYTINYPAGAEAVITLHQWPDMNIITLTPDDLAEGNGITETLQLDAGYYLLSVLVSKNGLYAGKSEAVHIYPALTTVYARNFSDNNLIAAMPPMTNDYTISGIGTFTYDGSPKTASITRTETASSGAITVLYNGTADAPVDAGTYTVSFNVAAARGFSEAAGLPAGTITINKAAGAAVSAPAGTSSVTTNSVTVNGVTAPENGQTVEYARNTTTAAPASGWQDSTTFSGLTAGTTYYIFAHAKENNNYETGAASGSLTVTTLQTASIEYYWVDRHGSLVTTSGGATSIAQGGTLTFTAQGTGYTVLQWRLNGINTGGSSNTYTFSSTTAGKHTVGLFVEKGGKFYNTNITITVVDKYTVSFNANGGSGTVPNAITATVGSSITLPSGNGLSRSGYTFGGWNTNSSGTGTNYNAYSSYTPPGNVTLYARWDIISTSTYTVSFNINSGSGTTPAAQTASSGSTITLPGGSGFSRSGYTFGGWNTNSSGTGANYSGSSSYMVTGDVTLYARWTGISTPTRTVVLVMDHYYPALSWYGSLRININGTHHADKKYNAGYIGWRETYTFSANGTVTLSWVTDNYYPDAQADYSFVVYYEDSPPNPPFGPNTTYWDGDNALIYRLRGQMTNLQSGALLGSFTVQ